MTDSNNENGINADHSFSTAKPALLFFCRILIKFLCVFCVCFCYPLYNFLPSDNTSVMPLKWKTSLATSAEFISERQDLQPLPGLVDSNSKQEPHPRMRPEAAHCSPVASQSYPCCLATVLQMEGGLAAGSSVAASAPAHPSS